MRTRSRLHAGSIAVALTTAAALLFTPPCALANDAESNYVVAPYLHFALSLGGAAGPYSTEYMLSNTESGQKTVTVTCFNESGVRVGPVPAPVLTIAATDVNVATMFSLELVDDPNFTGLGTCHFVTSAAADDISVGIVVGVQGVDPGTGTAAPQTSRILSSDASRLTAVNLAQGRVTNDDGNVPFWTGQASWVSVLLLLNPRELAGPLDLIVFNTTGGVIGSRAGADAITLPPRGMGLHVFPGFATSATSGHADLNLGGGASPRLMGYLLGLNVSSLESHLTQAGLDKDDTEHVSLNVTPP